MKKCDFFDSSLYVEQRLSWTLFVMDPLTRFCSTAEIYYLIHSFIKKASISSIIKLLGAQLFRPNRGYFILTGSLQDKDTFRRDGVEYLELRTDGLILF